MGTKMYLHYGRKKSWLYKDNIERNKESLNILVCFCQIQFWTHTFLILLFFFSTLWTQIGHHHRMFKGTLLPPTWVGRTISQNVIGIETRNSWSNRLLSDGDLLAQITSLHAEYFNKLYGIQYGSTGISASVKNTWVYLSCGIRKSFVFFPFKLS